MPRHLHTTLLLTLISGTVLAAEDMLLIGHHVTDDDSWASGFYTELRMARRAGAREGYDIYDRQYEYPAPAQGDWYPKAVTRIDGHDLDMDRRGTNSLSDFHFDLAVVIQNGKDIVGTNFLVVAIGTNSLYSYIPSTEHHVIVAGAPKRDLRRWARAD